MPKTTPRGRVGIVSNWRSGRSQGTLLGCMGWCSVSLNTYWGERIMTTQCCKMYTLHTRVLLPMSSVMCGQLAPQIKWKLYKQFISYKMCPVLSNEFLAYPVQRWSISLYNISILYTQAPCRSPSSLFIYQTVAVTEHVFGQSTFHLMAPRHKNDFVTQKNLIIASYNCSTLLADILLNIL